MLTSRSIRIPEYSWSVTSIFIHHSIEKRVLAFLKSQRVMMDRRRWNRSFVIILLEAIFYFYSSVVLFHSTTGTCSRVAVFARSLTYQCESDTNTAQIIGPNFYDIPTSTNRNESTTMLPEREYRVLAYYAGTDLPPYTSEDDPLPYDDDIMHESKHPLPTNPYWNSRDDTIILVNRYISRILLGCYNNTDMDNIFMDISTRPFAIPGTSFRTAICQRDGDYDFATIDLLQLLYVSRQYPGSLSNDVYTKIRDSLLTIYGRVSDNTFLVPCRVKVGPLQLSVTVKNNLDTENHILQTQISRYLTNQLLLEVHPENQQEYNNTFNGNTNWMLEYLSSFLRDYFYEYNSRPYQTFTVKALTVLHSFALHRKVVLVTEMILDIITAFSSQQMNTLRRFVPFRRQSAYVVETKSWPGESESYRLALLAGNYAPESGATITKTTRSISDIPRVPVLNDGNSVSTVASKYRLRNDFLWNLIYKDGSDDDDYFISNHDTIEMYYTSKHVLISAGGNSVKSNPASVDVVNRFCIFRRCLVTDAMLRFFTGNIFAELSDEERGWSRPTTIIPTKESSVDMIDMVRFDGHRDPGQVSLSRNLCVAPNFACGLQLQYGNIIEPIVDQCSIVVNEDWRFFDLSADGTTGTSCPSYGYYMAVYNRPCNECSNKADQYGFIEISHQIQSMTFEEFQQQVLTNNPMSFQSKGIQVYVLTTGKAITFEINPRSDDQSQILQVDGVDYGNPLLLERNYRSWPMVWSANKSIQSATVKGRWTFDTTKPKRQRMIYDVTDPLHPKRIVSRLPVLVKHPIKSIVSETIVSRYFDDSGSVLDNDSIQYISFHYNLWSVTSFEMVWRQSGLKSYHGSKRNKILQRRLYYEFALNETIVQVGIVPMILRGKERVHRIRIVTNLNHVIVAGYGKSTDEVVYNDNNIIAFHGRSDDDMILQLGVTAITA